MSWSTPTYPVAGTLITSSWASTYVVDNLIALHAWPPQHCDAYHSTTQTVNVGTPSVLSLDSERRDTNTMHDLATNNSRVTIKAGYDGTYWVIARTKRGTGAGTVLFSARKNGTTNMDTIDSRTESESMQVQTIMHGLIAGDYIEMYVDPQSNNVTVGSATAGLASRLIVIGPLPAD
jgi:hypothetical protein